METNNLGLSVKSTRQLERMIGDAYFVSSPLRFLVGMIQMFLASAAVVVFVVFCAFFWLFRSHDLRADLTKDFASEQAIYRVNVADHKVTHVSGTNFDKDTVAHAFSYGTDGGVLHGLTWVRDSWLADKSDAYETAYMTASSNVAALNHKLYMISGQFPKHVQVPVVEMSFLRATDEERRSPANGHFNWFTGICLEGQCSAEDFVPRNDSIFADAVAPQMTEGQAKAINALYATGTPEFWIAAAHANDILNEDAEIAAAAEKERASHGTPTHTFTVDEMIWDSVLGYAIFVLLGGIAFTLYAAHRIEETKKTAKS